MDDPGDLVATAISKESFLIVDVQMLDEHCLAKITNQEIGAAARTMLSPCSAKIKKPSCGVRADAAESDSDQDYDPSVFM